MENIDSSAEHAAVLRTEAEKRSKATNAWIDRFEPDELTPMAVRQAFNELHVHQIELEMQNEELRRAQLELDMARARYFDLYDLAPVGYCTLNEQGLIMEANLTAATLLGVIRGVLAGQPISRFILKEDQDGYCQQRKQLFATGETQSLELRMVKKEGAVFWVQLQIAATKDEGGAPVCRITLSDVTARKMLESELVIMAHVDTLTRTLNRPAFLEKASREIARARRTGMQCAVMFVDLDHFKSVNDTLGHSVGDELLKDTALGLAACIRETDMMARVGGDEFLILLNDLESGQGAQYIAERIREKFNAPRLIAGNDLFITASIGIAVYPHDGDSLEDLLKNADTAMYAAKESGRNMFRFFDLEMNKNAVTKMQVERDLRGALDKKEFVLFYQPVVNVADGRVRGFEALLRWFRTGGGLVFPDEFIPVAEETGLIVPIGAWVLDEACRFGKQLVDRGFIDLVISVNISVVQLRRKNLVDIIKSALDQNGLRPELLEIEVTESLCIESFDAAVEILKAISALGVLVSLDDFGTGYSSLVHLQKLPIKNLKIDRLFINEIAKESDENAMIPAIIDLTHKLKLGVVAEGVETGIQLEKLAANRCDYYQGYLFSKPLPADEVIPFMEAHNGKQG